MHSDQVPDEPAMPAGAVWWLSGPAAGGLRAYVDDVTRHLRAAGLPCVVLPLPAPAWRPNPTKPSGPPAGGGDPPAGRSGIGVAAFIGTVRALRSLARARPPRLIHAHGLKAAAVAALALPRVPLVMTLHTYPRGWWQRQVARWAAGHSRAVVAVSRALATWAALGGIAPPPGPGRPAQVHVLVPPLARHGRPPLPRRQARRLLGLPELGPVVGTVARLSPEKGVDVLLRAIALVHRAGFPVTCLVVGTGPDEPALRRLAARLGIDAWVCWAGPQEGAARLLRAVDVYVQPSRREAYGLAAAEAMAAGRPVVASRTGGLEELIRDGVDGRLVPPGDAHALARALVALLRDEKARHRLARAAAARASRWPDGARIARQHLQLYAQVASPAVAPRRGRRDRRAER
ncbi:glycosyl transferase group 1 [Thermaerobacter marianensis DSM 12885]|uniref:Glycosyl transferase group 1 n=1 Tax=Thermaerobacter marianensis (strain ATCC 700841 / DSM 12885 / JCM 10246 / 7p75a) TaxID=644966 RepID=E6SK74_THEM7|nr:glycosyltransferase [Thermaerobacter marianensis]ADU51215.1 glycosyl transferase group 1 [Thermaerobacter marianensis DSM 12885]